MGQEGTVTVAEVRNLVPVLASGSKVGESSVRVKPAVKLGVLVLVGYDCMLMRKLGRYDEADA
jgi:hypothetical protein